MVPRTLKVALALCVVLVAWAVIHAGVEYRLSVAVDDGRELGRFEHAVLAVDMFVVRWIPWGLLPVLFAPEAAIGSWAFLRWRGRYTPPAARVARAELKIWALVLAAGVGLGALAIAWSLRFRGHSLVALGITALFLFSWGYAGAVWAALWLQSARHLAGRSRLRASHLALLACLVAGCAPLHAFGVAIPVWVLWASRAEAKV